jgi:hypothetical protein
VDIETRRQKQQELMLRMVERRVRERAQQLYDERGPGDGYALKDWFQAEKEIIENTAIAQIYRRLKAEGQIRPVTNHDSRDSNSFFEHDSQTCESPA